MKSAVHSTLILLEELKLKIQTLFCWGVLRRTSRKKTMISSLWTPGNQLKQKARLKKLELQLLQVLCKDNRLQNHKFWTQWLTSWCRKQIMTGLMLVWAKLLLIRVWVWVSSKKLVRRWFWRKSTRFLTKWRKTAISLKNLITKQVRRSVVIRKSK